LARASKSNEGYGAAGQSTTEILFKKRHSPRGEPKQDEQAVEIFGFRFLSSNQEPFNQLVAVKDIS
jgi:hypothetical protein